MQKTHAGLLVITGASGGLGLALAQYYLEHGAVVGAIARRAGLLQTLAEKFPRQVYCYPLDVRDAVAMQAAARDFIARAGLPDIVIANAGVSVGTLTEHAEDIAAFQQVMDINVLGMVKTFQPFLAAMRDRRQGTLVGIASVAGFRGSLSRRPPLEVFPDMKRQPKLRPQKPSAFFEDKRDSRLPVPGTIPAGALLEDSPVATGRVPGRRTLSRPIRCP